MHPLYQWLVDHILLSAAGCFGATMLVVTLYTYIVDRERVTPRS